MVGNLGFYWAVLAKCWTTEEKCADTSKGTPWRRVFLSTWLSYNFLNHHHIQTSLPLLLILNQMKWVHTIGHQTCKGLILSSQIQLSLPCGPSPQEFLTNILYTLLISPMNTVCSASLTLPNLVTVITLKTYFGWQNNLFCRYKSLQESAFIQSY